jgi:hypothetical protein
MQMDRPILTVHSFCVLYIRSAKWMSLVRAAQVSLDVAWNRNALKKR